MKEFSKEIINIDGKDYTLFLNREGIVAWERITNASKNRKELEDSVKKYNSENDIVIKDGDNPFEITGVDKIVKSEQETIEYYKVLYWVMLYTNHKLDYKDVSVLFDKAMEEYGFQQLIDLSLQMLEDANINRLGENELKKLPALRPKKN